MYKINTSINDLPVAVDKIRIRSRVSKYTYQKFFQTLDELFLIDKFYERPSTSMDYRYNIICKTRGDGENATIYMGYVAGVSPKENTSAEASLVIDFNPNKVDYESLVFYLLFYYGILDNAQLDKTDILTADVAFDFFDKDINFFKVITSKTVYKHFENIFGTTKYYGTKKNSQIRLYDKIGQTRYEFDQFLRKDYRNREVDLEIESAKDSKQKAKETAAEKKSRDAKIEQLCIDKYGPEFASLNHWTRFEVSYKIKGGNLKYIFGDSSNKQLPIDEIAGDETYMNNFIDLYNEWRPLDILLNNKHNTTRGPVSNSRRFTPFPAKEIGDLDYTPTISPQEAFQKSNIKLVNPYAGTFNMGFSYPIISYWKDISSFGIVKPEIEGMFIAYMMGYMKKSRIPRKSFETMKEAIKSTQSHLQINELFAPYALREFTKNFFKISADLIPQSKPVGMSLQSYIIPDYKREIKKRFKTEYVPANMKQSAINIEWIGNKKEVTEDDFIEYSVSEEVA